MFLKHDTAFADADLLPGALTPRATGFAPELQIETESGWCAVGDLTPGMAVHTVEGGLQPVQDINLREQDTPRWQVPEGALNNCAALTLSAGTLMGLRDPWCLRLHGSPLVLCHIDALTGFRGIARAQTTATQTLYQLRFARSEMIYAQSGTLLLCPAAEDTSLTQSPCPILNYGQTRALLALSQRALPAADPIRLSGRLAA